VGEKPICWYYFKHRKLWSCDFSNAGKRLVHFFSSPLAPSFSFDPISSRSRRHRWIPISTLGTPFAVVTLGIVESESHRPVVRFATGRRWKLCPRLPTIKGLCILNFISCLNYSIKVKRRISIVVPTRMRFQNAKYGHASTA
jgi:hypothetical protein